MKSIEMAKFMAWMCGVFPQWKPDATIAPVWAGELPDVSADMAICLVRQIQARRPSPFPPSVFEIVASARPKQVSGRETWQAIQLSFKGRPRPDNPAVKKAVQLMGGWEVIGNSKENDPFVEKKFLTIWDELNASEAEQFVQLPTNQPLLK